MTSTARLASLALIALSACGGGLAADDGAGETFDHEGKFLTSDAVGRKALPVNVDLGSQVWAVSSSWGDTQTAAARAAGLAWGANSGLRWDEKFSVWVRGLPASTGQSGEKTYLLTTPYGKTLPMPVLECSEQALMLRALFASWYGLPFFVEAQDGAQRLFLGNFGFRSAAGRYKGTPNFRTAYSDYSARGSAAVANWPHDAALRTRHLTDYDTNDFLGANQGFGAWADEALLNKRMGWFLVYLLEYFGSMNLADDSNTFPLVPGALRTGDFLLERWQKNGIGHTLILKQVTALPGNQLGVELASGSMPRRQPLWEDAGRSRYYFLSEITGGQGNASDGSPYAKLGGGLRRFRVAQNVGGYWVNDVPAWTNNDALRHDDYTAIAARPGQFASLLGDVSPAQKLALITSEIDSARAALRQHPASCTSRTRREAFFVELTSFLENNRGYDRSKVEREYRATEDYYYPELAYGTSPTCCWDSTTPQMASIVDRYNRSRESTSAACLPPVPFTRGHLAEFKAYAQQIGEAANWLDWHEDEPCAARTAADDAALPQAAVDYCSIKSTLDASGR